MGVGDRVKAAREARGLERKDLARRTGIPYPTLAGIENGDQTSSTRLHKIADELGVYTVWLAENRGPRDVVETPGADWPDIAAFRQPASLGSGAEPDEWAESHKLKFRAESLSRKRLRADQLAVCYGSGDSMLPRIKSGDAILFDRADVEPKDGKLYVVTYDRQLMAKRLVNLGGRWFIESLNREHPKWAKPEPIDEHKGFVIHGRVRWIGSWED